MVERMKILSWSNEKIEDRNRCFVGQESSQCETENPFNSYASSIENNVHVAKRIRPKKNQRSLNNIFDSWIFTRHLFSKGITQKEICKKKLIK